MLLCVLQVILVRVLLVWVDIAVGDVFSYAVAGSTMLCLMLLLYV